MNDINTLVLQSCTVALRVEHGLCSEACVRSCDNGSEVISIRIKEKEIHIKEEDEPVAISSSAIKDEPEVSPQTFRWFLGSPSVIMPLVCLPSHINELPVVKGNGLCIFT
jgi:hypothetical protein